MRSNRNSKRPDNNREKIIMIASSAFVIAALTMTGIYMRQSSQEEQDNGYTIDFSALESSQEDPQDNSLAKSNREQSQLEDDLDYTPMGLEETIEDPSQEANSGTVQNPGLTGKGKTDGETGGNASDEKKESDTSKDTSKDGSKDNSKDSFKDTSKDSSKDSSKETFNVSGGTSENLEASGAEAEKVDAVSADTVQDQLAGEQLIQEQLVQELLSQVQMTREELLAREELIQEEFARGQMSQEEFMTQEQVVQEQIAKTQEMQEQITQGQFDQGQFDQDQFVGLTQEQLAGLTQEQLAGAGDVPLLDEEGQPIQQEAETRVLSFDESLGIAMPVSGEILMPYNMEHTVYFKTLDQYKFNPAMVVSAAEGSVVTACADGRVLSVFSNEEIGNALTLDLGNGYQATYGQLQDIRVSEGDYVTRYDVLGNVSAPTIYYSLEGSNLYFQLSRDGNAVDPETLIH